MNKNKIITKKNKLFIDLVLILVFIDNILLELLSLQLMGVFESLEFVESTARVFQPMPRHVIDFHGRIARALVRLTSAHLRQV